METGHLVVILLLVSALLIALFVIFFIYVKRHTGRRERIQNKLRRDWTGKIDHHTAFAVRACTKDRFHKFWKIFPWSRTGLLFIGDTEVNLVLIDRQNKGIVRTIRRDPGGFQWVGQKFWPNGLLSWFMIRSADETYYITSETGLTIINSEKTTWEIFCNTKPGPPPRDFTPPPAPGDFALEKHPLSLAIIGMFFVLLCYALIDTYFLIEEDYLRFPFLSVTILFGIGVAAISSVFTFRSRIPNVTGVVLSLFLAFAAAGSLYPGMLRINQITGDSELFANAYYVDFDNDRLVPDDPSLPHFSYNMKSTREFWQQLDPAEPFMIELRKGGLGFHQVRMTPIYDRISKFYKEKRNRNKSLRPAPDDGSPGLTKKADHI